MKKLLSGIIASVFVFAIAFSPMVALAAQGIAIGDDTAAQLTSTIAFAISIGYYVVVRFIEKRYPQFGWLLGVPAKPTYKEIK